MAKHPHLVLSGYYGFQNSGDDAVCYAIIHELRRQIPGVMITVLSNDPPQTEAAYGVRAVSRWQPLKVMRTLRGADLLISGGGSLLQDVTSRNGILYYLGVLEMAHQLGVPQLIYAQGMGPVSDERNQKLVARVLNHAAAITVRDPASRILLKEMGVRRPVMVTPDPVLGLSPSAANIEAARRLLMRQGWRGERPLLLCAPRAWGDDDRVPLFSGTLDKLAQDHDVLLLAMQPQNEGALCQAVSGHMTQRAFVVAETLDTPTLLGLFSLSDMVIAMRLHALIMGALGGARLAGVSYDPKVEAVLRLLQGIPPVDVRELDVDTLVAHARAVLSAPPIDPQRVALLGQFSKLPAKLAEKWCNQAEIC